MPRGKGQDQIGGGFQKETGSLGNITTKISCVFSATAVPQNFCFKMASRWLCSLIITDGGLRKPMTADDHPNLIHQIPLFALNELNRPQVAQRRPPMN